MYPQINKVTKTHVKSPKDNTVSSLNTICFMNIEPNELENLKWG